MPPWLNLNLQFILQIIGALAKQNIDRFSVSTPSNKKKKEFFMKISNLFWFTGIWFSVPTGLLLAYCYAEVVKVVRGDILHPADHLESIDYQIMICMVVGMILFVFLINLKKKFVDGEDNFSPFKRSNIENSADKRKAQKHPIPQEYLSTNPSGFTVGKKGSKYVRLPFFNSPFHQLILGSPGSNKSTSILNALLWNFNFEKEDRRLRSVLAVDCKPELSKKSVYECRDDVKIINPTSKNSWGFDVWYGLSQDSSDDDIKERAEVISRSLIKTLSGDNLHFSSNAQKILSGFLMYGFRKKMKFVDSILQVIHVPVEDLIAEIITDSEMKSHQKIIGKVKSFDGNTSDEFASIKSTLEQDLNIFDTDTVKYCFDDNPNKVTPADLDKGISVFLAIPDHLMTMYSTVFGLIIELSLKYLMSISEDDLQNKRPVWCLVDEGGTIYVPSLLDVASRGRSKKIQLSLVAQSYSQLQDLYGDRQARSILDCCKSTIVFSCNDVATARDLSARCGNYRETKVSIHEQGLIDNYNSSNISEEYRPIMDVSDIAKLERDNLVLVFSHGEWFLAKKAPYYTIKLLNNKSNELVQMNKDLASKHYKKGAMKYE